MLAELDFTSPRTRCGSPPWIAAYPARRGGHRARSPRRRRRSRRRDSPDGMVIDVEALYAGLMRDREFALAGWLADALEYPPAVSAAHQGRGARLRHARLSGAECRRIR